MIGLGLAALPQKLLAEAVGFVIETVIVVAVTWHFVAGYESSKFNAERLAQIQAVADSQEHARTVDNQLAAARQEIVDAQDASRAQAATLTAAFTADANSMRNQLGTALSGRGIANDSLDACQRRAATAGNLLADGLQVQAKLAGAAESHAADIRAVRALAARQSELVK
jgi:hypothetical protein